MSDVLIIGSGFAGMTAALQLAQHGMKVAILEAKDRPGGRVLTLHDPVCNAPIELGAEFIHGFPAQIWDVLRKHRIPAHEVAGDTWCLRHGKLTECDFFSDVNDIFGRMRASQPDRSFADFLCHTEASEDAKTWASGYVTGFHGADPSLISLHSLVRGTKADEEIDGERSFRIPQHGYEALRQILLKELSEARVEMHLSTVVKKVAWRKGELNIHAEHLGKPMAFHGDRCLVTLPLSVLQASPREPGAVQFDPVLPAQKISALEKLVMGKVIRITMCFSEPFWHKVQPPGSGGSLQNLSFLLSQEEWFPTWWTLLPEQFPVLTGWATFENAERLSGKDKSFVLQKAIATLATITGVNKNEIERLVTAAYTHDWQNDPFSRGAYSYVKVGGEGAQQALGEALDGTLFFAGEATDITGHHGTVHGAIASGYRAAAEIVNS
jgi:monoamine oxidase